MRVAGSPRARRDADALLRAPARRGNRQFRREDGRVSERRRRRRASIAADGGALVRQAEHTLATSVGPDGAGHRRDRAAIRPRAAGSGLGGLGPALEREQRAIRERAWAALSPNSSRELKRRRFLSPCGEKRT